MSESRSRGPRSRGAGGRPGGGRRPGQGAGRGPRGAGSESKPKGPPVEPLHPTLNPPDVKTFYEWELGDELQAAIAAMGIETPTPIQCLAIGPALEGRDVIAKAETGTGKTLAFGAPIVAKIDPGRKTVLALVLCPTRELAQQVASTLEVLANARGATVALVVGGEPMHPQVDALQAGAQIVVGTPGRILDLEGQGFLKFPWAEFVVLDEADEMLEIGFIDDVRKILAKTPDERQTMHFSATFPTEVLALARESTRDPIEVATAKGPATVKAIDQSWMAVGREDRVLALMRLIENSEKDDVFLVFCDRRTEVDQLLRRLERQRFSVKALHGGYDQAARFRVMDAFRSTTVKVLVATDVASRGLDVAHVTHVVNFSVPQDVSDYTHRIGRTGRAGRSGNAITLVCPEHDRRWRQILRDATWDVLEVEPPRRGARRDDEPRRGGGRGGDRGPRRGGRNDGGERGRERREPQRAEGDVFRPRERREREPRPEPVSEQRSEPRREPRTERPAEPSLQRAGRPEPEERGAGPRKVVRSTGRALSTRERLARERAGATEAAPPQEREARPERAERERRPRRERPESEPRRERRPRGEGREPRAAEEPRPRDAERPERSRPASRPRPENPGGSGFGEGL